MTELRRVSKSYDMGVQSFPVGFEAGFFKALDFMGVLFEDLKLPADLKGFADENQNVPLGSAPK